MQQHVPSDISRVYATQILHTCSELGLMQQTERRIASWYLTVMNNWTCHTRSLATCLLYGEVHRILNKSSSEGLQRHIRFITHTHNKKWQNASQDKLDKNTIKRNKNKKQQHRHWSTCTKQHFWRFYHSNWEVRVTMTAYVHFWRKFAQHINSLVHDAEMLNPALCYP